jgi:hypothetical protein
MKSFNIAIRILLAWAALGVIQAVAGMLVPLHAPAGGANIFAWILLTNALVVTVLGLAALRSHWQGWRLAAALFVIPFGIAFVNMIEGAVYLTGSGIDWRMLLLFSFVVYAVAAPVWLLIFRTSRKQPEPAQPLPLMGRSWRLVASDFVYLLLYFSAGMIIFPFVRDFYATQTIPPAAVIVGLQLLLRGPVFTILCLVLLHMLDMKRSTGALAVGAAFTILSGVAPLLIPNPVFPDAVRWVHFCEVTSSNFVFGAFVGWLWRPPEKASPLVAQRAA